jgi:CRP/FNR family transcriptional regulator, cyclic AMP receptor protein
LSQKGLERQRFDHTGSRGIHLTLVALGSTFERSTSLTQVLLEDPELGVYLDGPRLASAARDCVAKAVEVSSGVWNPSDAPPSLRTGIGLLMLDGLLVRQVGVGGRFGAELIGAGDLIRPWQLDDKAKTLPRTGRWRALGPCRMAVLDKDFTMRLTRYPEVTSCLFSRAMRRASHIAVQIAIVHQPRIDVRLRMLFWELADRWGTVHGDGVHVPLQLTHAMLADLVAARRPTVTKALGELADAGAVSWSGNDWLLSGEPPLELQAVGSVSVSSAD